MSKNLPPHPLGPDLPIITKRVLWKPEWSELNQRMMKNAEGIFVSVAFVALSGCSALTSPIEKPIIEDHSGNLGTFATVAERRMVITKKDYSNVAGKDVYESKFCAEPPPDATQSIASALTAALSGNAAGLKAKPEVSVEFAKSLETTAKSLFQRSQGIQLFRDGLYNLCQAYLNGAVDTAQYNTLYAALLTTASVIIKDEVAKMPSVPILRAEEAATASEAAKDAAVKAKVSVATAQTEIEASVKKAQSAATEATESKNAAETSQASLDAAVKKAEDAATRAEEAAKEAGSSS
jgi:hypothetical protein